MAPHANVGGPSSIVPPENTGGSSSIVPPGNIGDPSTSTHYAATGTLSEVSVPLVLLLLKLMWDLLLVLLLFLVKVLYLQKVLFLLLHTVPLVLIMLLMVRLWRM